MKVPAIRVPKLLLPSLCFFVGCQSNQVDLVDHVGPLPAGGHLMPTHQLIRPAGQAVEYGGRQGGAAEARVELAYQAVERPWTDWSSGEPQEPV